MKKFLIIIISSLLSFFTFAHDNNATDKDQGNPSGVFVNFFLMPF